jgi:DNA-directed RNA polymerase specialized sigma24 family protein
VPWPPDDELLAAWRRLAADPTATGEFFLLTLRPLAQALLGWRPATDPDDAESAATDAVLAFCKHPERYDPERLGLPAFLRMIARRRLLNLFDKQRRHHDGRIPWDAVELDTPARNEEDDDPPPVSPAAQAVIDALNEVDRQLFELMVDRERKTGVYAAVLGVADRPADEQRREVKKAKDRINARFKRAVGGGDG